MSESVFTKSEDIKPRTVAANDLAFAFLTNMPITPGHTLVSPKRFIATIEEMTEAEIIDVFALATLVKEGLRKTYGAEGFNCAWNEGSKYGQSVQHFHLHVVPRTPNDSGIINYEPREFLYRPGSRETSPEAELTATADLRQEIELITQK
jgi:diadenosine tetraphosphate (Ap4A) HIT family hydrolase